MTVTERRIPSRPTISTAILAAAVGAGLLLCYLLAIPFLSAIVWSFTLAIIFAPLEARLRRAVPSAGSSATAVVAVVAAIIVIPAFVMTGALLREAERGAALVRTLTDSEGLARMLDSRPWLAPLRDFVNEQFDLADLATAATSWLAGWSGAFVKGSFSGMLSLILTFYFLFYLLRDRGTIRTAVENALPLTAEEFAVLATRVVDTISATVLGLAAMAILQGVLGGAMFWFLGLPAPLFWGLLMGLLAMVPFLGAFMVWGPAAIVLALAGDFASAAIMAAWGAIVVGLADNLAYPILVGSKLRLHTVPSFIAIAGGLVLLGAPGIIVGPLVVAVSVTLIGILRTRLSQPPEPSLPRTDQPASESPAGALGRAGMATRT